MSGTRRKALWKIARLNANGRWWTRREWRAVKRTRIVTDELAVRRRAA